MAASDNFRLVNTSENAIPKYIPGMAADIKGLREELDKKFDPTSIESIVDSIHRPKVFESPRDTL